MSLSLINKLMREYMTTCQLGIALCLALPSLLYANQHCAEDNVGASRIVSVGGAITETIYALGQGDRIVATDTTSYFPAAAEDTPKVGYQRALSAEGILSTKPDLVIASDQAGPNKVIKQLQATGLALELLPTASNIDQVLDNITRLGTILCAKKTSADLVASIQTERQKLPTTVIPKQHKVLFIMQHGGGAPMVAGRSTSAAHIIALSGAQNAMDQFEGYKPLTPEALLTAKPDFILTTDRGIKQSGGHEGILSIPGMKLTPAGKQKAIVSMDSLLLLGFGPRTIEAAKRLHNQLYSSL